MASRTSQTVMHTLSDGGKIPWIAFGTGSALFMQDANRAVKQAIECGVTHFDGAQAYNNEESLGAGIKTSGRAREDLYITTKLGQHSVHGGPSVSETLKESLRKLGTDYVDLFLIHSPGVYKKEATLPDVWREMEEAKTQGLTKSIGVSNFGIAELQTVLQGAIMVPAVNQIELHPYVWQTVRPLVEFCQSKGITVASYGGLYPAMTSGPLEPLLADIAERLGAQRGTAVTPSQVLMKWMYQKAIVVVTTSSKACRIRAYLDTLAVPDLSMEDMTRIEEVGSSVVKRKYNYQH